MGFIGDKNSIEPLVGMLQNDSLTAGARGFAAVALGIVADKEDLPWNSKIALDRGLMNGPAGAAAPPYTAAYVIPRRCPSVEILPSAMRRFMAGRMLLASVPRATAICSPRWPGWLRT